MRAQPRFTCAPLLRRALSLIYEALLLTAVLWCAGFVYAIVESKVGSTHMRSIYQCYLFGVSGTYFVWQWQQGQTLPMKTWRIRLVTKTGERLSLRQAVLRFLVAAIGLVLVGIGFLWAFVDHEHLFLHDRVAGTRLVGD